MDVSQKKSLKWLWVIIALAVVALLGLWCGLSASKAEDVFNFSNTFVLFAVAFVIAALGYLLGRVHVRGVSLGTAGVFLMAILIGWMCTLDFKDVPLLGSFHVNLNANPLTDGKLLAKSEWLVDTLGGPVQNIGLILFVGAVGFIAGPNFFKNLKKNFKTYILLGIVIISAGTLVAVLFTLVTDYGPEYWAGVLSGALTSTPGFSAARDAAPDSQSIITLGHAIAYPFGVVGVVLFVQLVPKFLKADMEKERSFLKVSTTEANRRATGLFAADPFGIMPFALAIVCGLLLGSVTIPLSGKGYDGPCFSLGTTGGVLIMCLVFGHFGRIGRLSLQISEATLKVFRELGLMFFLLGAGFEGGVSLVTEITKAGGADIVIWGFIGGAVMTVVPMAVGFVMAKFVLHLPLLNNLGSITGGMTSTPALGTLINVSKTDDVASAYASTYPIALVLIVLASQLMIILM